MNEIFFSLLCLLTSTWYILYFIYLLVTVLRNLWLSFVLQVEVKRAVPKGEDVLRTRRIFLGGLPLEATEQDIKDGLRDADFGDKIEDIKVMTEKGSERPRGFAFVVMRDCDDVEDLMIMKRFSVRVRSILDECGGG